MQKQSDVVLTASEEQRLEKDNGRLEEMPIYVNIEATYWKMKYEKARYELASIHRAYAKLVRNKKQYNKVGLLCKEAYDNGVNDTLLKKGGEE